MATYNQEYRIHWEELAPSLQARFRAMLLALIDEMNARKSADTDILNLINQEMTNRANGDNHLYDLINSLITYANSAFASLKTKIYSEAGASSTEDARIKKLFNDENASDGKVIKINLHDEYYKLDVHSNYLIVDVVDNDNDLNFDMNHNINNYISLVVDNNFIYSLHNNSIYHKEDGQWIKYPISSTKWLNTYLMKNRVFMYNPKTKILFFFYYSGRYTRINCR